MVTSNSKISTHEMRSIGASALAPAVRIGQRREKKAVKPGKFVWLKLEEENEEKSRTARRVNTGTSHQKGIVSLTRGLSRHSRVE
jgi:hypothetical protein